MALDRVIDLFNAARAENGLSPLKAHAKLMASAREHSDDMAKHEFLDSVGSDWTTPGRRFSRKGYEWTRSGESCAHGQKNAEDVVRAFLADPKHKAIILGRGYTHVGIAVTDWYWTADFGAGDADAPPAPESFRV